MAIDSKISFLNQMENRLSSEVTTDMMNRVMQIVSDVLEGFDMKEQFRDENGVDDMLSGFLSALKVEGRSQKTIDRYAYVIKRLTTYLNIPTRKITVYHLRDYLAHEKERGLADGTLKGLREIFSA